MVIVPSIDVRAARVVARGAVIDMTPSELARHFVASGARELHLVDLDMAERGDPENLALLAHIARTCGVPARLAGGIASVAFGREALDAGFSGVLFSSAVFGNDDLLGEIAQLPGAVVEIEARRPADGSSSGWLEPRGGAPDLAEIARGRGVLAASRRALERGVRDLYVIDLGSEGALGGPAIELLERIREALGASASRMRFHTGGGVGSLEHISALARWGAASAVVGRALAMSRFTMAEAQAAADAETPSDS